MTVSTCHIHRSVHRPDTSLIRDCQSVSPEDLATSYIHKLPDARCSGCLTTELPKCLLRNVSSAALILFDCVPKCLCSVWHDNHSFPTSLASQQLYTWLPQNTATILFANSFSIVASSSVYLPLIPKGIWICALHHSDECPQNYTVRPSKPSSPGLNMQKGK